VFGKCIEVYKYPFCHITLPAASLELKKYAKEKVKAK
jgi:hypothetical protein